MTTSIVVFLCSFFGIGCIISYLADEDDLNFSTVLKSIIAIALILSTMSGFPSILKIEGRASAISDKVTLITNTIQSPEALLKKAQVEKEKLEQELKDAKEELKKKQTF